MPQLSGFMLLNRGLKAASTRNTIVEAIIKDRLYQFFHVTDKLGYDFSGFSEKGDVTDAVG